VLLHDGTDSSITNVTGDLTIKGASGENIDLSLGGDTTSDRIRFLNNTGTVWYDLDGRGFHLFRMDTGVSGTHFAVREEGSANNIIGINAVTDVLTFGNSSSAYDNVFDGTTGTTVRINDDIPLNFGDGSDWSLEYDTATPELALSGAAAAADNAGTALNIAGSNAGTHGGTGAGVDGGNISITAGAGNEATDNAASDAGDGGTSNFFGGSGGTGIDGTNDHDGGLGGDINLWAGAGGTSGSGGDSTGGVGGTAFLQGGAGGASAGGGAEGNGGTVKIRGGDGATDGSVDIGDSQTASVNLGNASTSPAVSVLSVAEAASATSATFTVAGGAGIKKDLYVGGDIILTDADDTTGQAAEATITMAERNTDSGTPSDGGTVYVKTVASNPELFYHDENGNITQLTGVGYPAGSVVTLTSGEAFAVGDLLHIDNDGGVAKAYQADANGPGLEWVTGIALVAATAADESIPVMTGLGQIVTLNTINGTPAAANIGDEVFLDTTPGEATLTSPSTSGDTVFSVGVLYSTTQVIFQPRFITEIG
jgi:hypothetical protein